MAQQIAAGNAGWPFQFRFAVHAGWSRVPELWTLDHYESQLSISLGASSLGRRCRCLFPRRLFLSLEEDWHQYVEGMVADKHRQFEDGAPICSGDPKISTIAFSVSVG
jgi:hypothetical protein